MSKEDKKVPFTGINAAALPVAGGNLVALATIPAGKTMFLTRVVVSNLGAAAAADELRIYDEAAGAACTANLSLLPDIRVPYQSTVIVDLGDDGIPVSTAISATANTAANSLIIYDVSVVGYYL